MREKEEHKQTWLPKYANQTVDVACNDKIWDDVDKTWRFVFYLDDETILKSEINECLNIKPRRITIADYHKKRKLSDSAAKTSS